MIEQTEIKQEEGCNRRRKETRVDVETTRSSLHSRSQKPTYPDIPGSARHRNTMNKVQLGEPRPSGTHLGPSAWHGPDGGLEATAACIRVLTDSFLVSRQISEIMRSHATSTDVPAKNMPGCLSQHTSTLLDITFIADRPASCDAAAASSSTAGDSCGASVRHFFATWRSHIRKQCTLDSP